MIVAAMFTVFTVEIDGQEVTWNVTAIGCAARAGLFGPPEVFPVVMFRPTDWSKGNISRKRVDEIKLDPIALADPVFAIEAAPPDDDKILCFCDGQHRITARLELGLPNVRAFVVPWHQERGFRL